MVVIAALSVLLPGGLAALASSSLEESLFSTGINCCAKYLKYAPHDYEATRAGRRGYGTKPLICMPVERSRIHIILKCLLHF